MKKVFLSQFLVNRAAVTHEFWLGLSKEITSLSDRH